MGIELNYPNWEIGLYRYYTIVLWVIHVNLRELEKKLERASKGKPLRKFVLYLLMFMGETTPYRLSVMLEEGGITKDKKSVPIAVNKLIEEGIVKEVRREPSRGGYRKIVAPNYELLFDLLAKELGLSDKLRDYLIENSSKITGSLPYIDIGDELKAEDIIELVNELPLLETLVSLASIVTEGTPYENELKKAVVDYYLRRNPKRILRVMNIGKKSLQYLPNTENL